MPTPAGPVPTLLLQAVPDPTPGGRRLHLDVSATDRDRGADASCLLAGRVAPL